MSTKSEIPAYMQKRGFLIIDSNNKVILDAKLYPLIFNSKEAAELHMAENNIIGTVR